MPEQSGNSSAPPSPLSIEGVLRSAWALTHGVKARFFQAVLLVVILSAVLRWTFSLFTDGKGLFGALLLFVLNAIVAALVLGVNVMGIARARGQAPGPGTVLQYVDDVLPIALTSLLANIIIGIGWKCLFLPGVYFAVAYSFALPLVVDKGLGIWDALETSRQRVTRQWFTVFGLLAIVVFGVCVSALALLIPLLWTLPWAIICYGLTYNALFDDLPSKLIPVRRES